MKVATFCFLLFMALSADASSISSSTQPDSLLVLTHLTNGTKVHIPLGGQILCKPRKRRRVIGELRRFQSDSLTIGNQTLAVEEVEHIRYFGEGKKWQEGLGILFKAVGTFFFLISSIGIFSLLLNPIEGGGGILMILSPIWLGALAFMFFGRFLFRKGKYFMKDYQID
ncbi:MAG: hypothetical protein AAF587_18370 [Bacteroidota bacterium]